MFTHLVYPTIKVAPRDVLGTRKYSAERVLPDRMRAFHVGGYVDLVRTGAVFSDLYRTPDMQWRARRNRRGSLRPWDSSHVGAFAGDLSIRESMKELGCRTKAELDEHMRACNFHCHIQKGDTNGFEGWHYDWIPAWDDYYMGERSSRPARERFMMDQYGAWFRMDDDQIDGALRELGYIDGAPGDMSRTQSVKMFQDDWFLVVDGDPGRNTQRALAVATARQLYDVEPE